MKTRKYDPLIPGTELNRIGYLRELDEYHRNDAYLGMLIATPAIRKVADDGILTVSQIASVFRCTIGEVKGVLGIDYPAIGRVRGHFDPLCIQTIIGINTLQADHKEIPQGTLMYIGRMITPSLFHIFTGINRQNLHRAIHS